VREYIWLPESEIAPTREANAQVDRPLALVNAVGTASVAIWNVSIDHLNRPVLMTNSLKGPVWTAVWQPWGGAHSITGTGVLDARFPGQWYQTETGLHYNWHRSYDPAVGRYTKPDPLGFVDGPSVYGYAKGRALTLTDRFGKQTTPPPPPQIPGGPWKWSPDPDNGRGGTWRDPSGKSGTWDAPDGHWDVDDGKGGRQRYNRHGAPISPGEAHGSYKGPRRLPFPSFCPPFIYIPLPNTTECYINPMLPQCQEG
jgi:RHS repeat-associated protein